MKLKLTKPKTLIYSLLFGLALVASSIAVSISGNRAYAAMSFDQLENKINSAMRNYCAPVKGDNYPKCTGTYTAGAGAVYNASSEKQVNSQMQAMCTPPIQNWSLNGSVSDCGAFVEGVGTAQDILGKPFYNGGGSQGGGGGSGGSGGGGGGGNPAPKAPPISECDSIKDADIKKECKKDYRACNQPPYSLQHIANCKKQAIANAKEKAANKGKNPDGKGGADGKGADGKSQPETPNYMIGTHQCGNLPDVNDNVKTKFNFGCLGDKGPAGLGPIQDLVFAIIRFLSVGVGIAVTISLIMAGIQYASAEGNPDSSQKAKLRVQQALIGLGVYIFAFSILQFLIPGGIFKPGSWLTDPVPLLIFLSKFGALI